jgi:hypothetical protein
MRKTAALVFGSVVLFGGALFATSCGDDDTIGQNLDQAIETVDQVGEDVGDEVDEQIDDIGDDETATPEPTETP